MNRLHVTSVLLALTLVVLLLLPSAAQARVWTDQEDYSPGATVTIHGENSDGVAYTPGETVLVSVSGPNNYTGSCEAAVANDGKGSWACDVVLANDESAEGAYTYTAVGQSSGTIESGNFTDWVGGVAITSPVALISPVTISALPGSVSVTFSYYTSSQGTTTATAWVGKVVGETPPYISENWMWSSSATIASGGAVTSPKSATVNVPIASPAANDWYSVKVTVRNDYQVLGVGIKTWTAYSLAAVQIAVPTCAAPSIAPGGNPANQTVTYGGNTSFSAAATGNPAPTAQWQVRANGGAWTNLAGETNGSLTLTRPTVSMSGNQYRAVFTNSCGPASATTAAATLTVNPANATCNISGYSGVYDGTAHGASGACTGIGGETAGTLNLGTSFTDVPGGAAHWVFTGNGNYSNQAGDVGITIGKATLTVTADNQTILFGQPLPTFTFQYSGFVNGETASVINVAPTCAVGAIPKAGSYPITCSGGLDNNYQFTYVNGALTVQPWTLNGFYQPVDMSTGTTLIYNTVKNGSTVPLKFEVFAGPTELTDVSAVKSLTYAPTACDATAVSDDIETLATGGTVLRYDTTTGQFIYNWQTPRTAGQCYRVTVTTQDGSSLMAYFRLK